MIYTKTKVENGYGGFTDYYKEFYNAKHVKYSPISMKQKALFNIEKNNPTGVFYFKDINLVNMIDFKEVYFVKFENKYYKVFDILTYKRHVILKGEMIS